MMRPPERLAIPLPGSLLVRHLALLICKVQSENRSRPRDSKQVCEKWTLTNSLAADKIPYSRVEIRCSAKQIPCSVE
jgi:hypothetical protein